MKVLIGAAAAVLLFATAAGAQTTSTTAPAETASTAPVPPSQCPATPADPTIPDGATADTAAMAAANDAYRAWAEAMQSLAACHHAEYDQATAVLRQRRDEHNAVADRLNTVTASWTAASQAYCARPHMRCTNTSTGPAAGAGH